MKLVVRHEDIVAPFFILIITGLIQGIVGGIAILLTTNQVIQMTMDMLNSMGFNLSELMPGIDFISYMNAIIVVTAGLVAIVTPVMTIITWGVSFILLLVLIIIFGNFENPGNKKLISLVGYASIPLFFYAIVNSGVSLFSNLLTLVLPGLGIANYVIILTVVSVASLVIGIILAVIFKGWSAYLVYRGIEGMGVEENTVLISILYGVGIIIVPLLLGTG